MAVNGTESSFLAGGEFPYPVVQGGANNAVTVQFKEFGIRLNFTPHVMPDGMIRLKVSPEVSALDFTNGLNVSGFTVPALTSRKATTEVDLRDGQSFAIAGLMDNRTTELAAKIPVLSSHSDTGSSFQEQADQQDKYRTAGYGDTAHRGSALAASDANAAGVPNTVHRYRQVRWQDGRVSDTQIDRK